MMKRKMITSAALLMLAPALLTGQANYTINDRGPASYDATSTVADTAGGKELSNVTYQGSEYTITLDKTEVKYSTKILSHGGDLLGGTLLVDGVEYSVYLPANGPFNVKNTRAESIPTYKAMDILLFSNACRIGVDYDKDGAISNGEYWAANHPIRFGNRMLEIKSISEDGKRVVLAESSVPVAGLIVGQLAPDFAFTDQAGKTHTLADYRGKYLILDLWSVTCSPCRANMAQVKELQQQVGEDKLAVLLFSADKSYGISDAEERNKATLEKLGISWDNVLIPDAWNTLVRKFNTHGYGLWMIDPTGKVVVAGPGHNMDAVRTAIQ
jgi:peroxiredoxin